jgi:ketosteroid isomerase-like protein
MSDVHRSETEGNRRTIREAFEAWQQGTRPITDVFAPGMTWKIEGHSAASKQYESKQQFIDEVLAPFGARFVSGERFRPQAIRSIHADGDTVIVLWDGRGVANDGAPYENSYAWFMTLKDGLVVDGTAFFDSISFNELWARVRPA